MRYAIVIEKKDPNYSAYVPDLPGCVATGQTLDDVKSKIHAAMIFHLEKLRENGEQSPLATCRVDEIEVMQPAEKTKYLFRYESFSAGHSEASIQNLFSKGEIYLNSRTQFNDPFDFLPKLEGDLLKKHLSKNYRGLSKLNRHDRRKALSDRDPEKIFQKHFKNMIDSFGIKSFSTENDNILLWSHYAQGHLGYCIKFEPLDSELKNAIKINYSHNRPVLNKIDFIEGGLKDLMQRER